MVEQDIWEDSSVRFLDPFTKSGVFLREIASRLTNGLAAEISLISRGASIISLTPKLCLRHWHLPISPACWRGA